jgi:hypothetical protein
VNFFKEMHSAWYNSGDVKGFHNRVPPSIMNIYTTVDFVCQVKNQLFAGSLPLLAISEGRSGGWVGGIF